MGLSASSLSRSRRRSRSRTPHRRSKPAMPSPPPPPPVPESLPRDLTLDLPDEVFALVFHSLGPADRNRCSLVCRRWLAVEAGSRHRLSLDARAELAAAAPALLGRFDAVTKLALKCDRRTDSIDDAALALLSSLLPRLSRLKLRACRRLTDSGFAVLATNCPGLRKLSCASCCFGPKAIAAVLGACPLLEDLSIKRLRGLPDSAAAPLDPDNVASFSLRSVCLKDLYNAQCFTPLIAASPNLRSLKILRCAGVWDPSVKEIATRGRGLTEVQLERLQLSDHGLFALSGCTDLEVLHLVKAPECTDEGVIAVAERCRRLRKIHIDGWRTNRIGDASLMAIARGCPELQELVLIGVYPSVLSLGLIGGGCRALERLAFCGCETVRDAEISCIAMRCKALKKLCIKGCPVSDRGMEALAEGCPSLIKVKLRRCHMVTAEGVEWLRMARGSSLAVSLDAAEQEQDAASASESGILETGAAQIAELADQVEAMDIPSSSSSSQSVQTRNRMRNFVVSAMRRWSSGNGNPPHP